MKKNILCLMFAGLVAFPATILAGDEATAQATDNAATAEPAREHYTLGSVISLGFGAGWSGLTYEVADINNRLHSVDYTANIRYTYYFKNWVGFTTGFDFSTYGAFANYNGIYSKQFNNNTLLIDNKSYTHTLNFNSDNHQQPLSYLSEEQNLYFLEVPIALSFKYQPKKVGFLGTIGLKAGFPITGKYIVTGEFNHVGTIEALNCTVTDVKGYCEKETLQGKTGTIDTKGRLATISCEAFAEAGAMFEVHPRVNLSVSLYAGVGLNDLNASNERKEIGFATEENQLNANVNMAKYEGLIGTNLIPDAFRQFNFGVKVAAHINVGKSDEQRARDKYIAPSIVYVHDTISKIVRDTIQKEILVRDTITVKEQVAKQLDKILNTSIIYFKVNDYEHPIIEPSYMLDSVAAVLVRHQDMRVSVEGHASKDGSAAVNKRLASDRAKAVAELLESKGVKSSQLVVRSFGADHPFRYGNQAGNDPNKDRRVEIIPIK